MSENLMKINYIKGGDTILAMLFPIAFRDDCFWYAGGGILSHVVALPQLECNSYCSTGQLQ